MDKRSEYLDQLAKDYNIDSFVVDSIADILGENEDYDGLISSLEDWNDLFE